MQGKVACLALSKLILPNQKIRRSSHFGSCASRMTQRTWSGQNCSGMIAIEPQEWLCFQTCSIADFLQLLQDLATQVHLKSCLQQPHSSNQKQPPLITDN